MGAGCSCACFFASEGPNAWRPEAGSGRRGPVAGNTRLQRNVPASAALAARDRADRVR